MANDLLPEGYARFLGDLKERISAAQVRAALSVNRELIYLYWQLGREIATALSRRSWGSRVLDRLARDLQAAFPGVEGFSQRNLYRMRAFYEAYPEEQHFVTQAVSQLPWGHNIVLFQRLKDPQLRLWYATKALEHGWSRAILAAQIDTRLHLRQGQAATNFARTLPAPQSDLAQQLLKDPYTFDFLTLGADAHERAIEQGLLEHLRAFLLELGVGFAFVGNQYHLPVGDDDFYIDLLFYHLRLRCYVVIELKARDFQPGDAGQMLLYLAAVDDQLRHPDDQPTIGLILCRGKNKLTAEYTLRYTSAPIGVADYQITAALPDDLATDLPTVDQLEAELGHLIEAPEAPGNGEETAGYRTADEA